ncbi:MAG: diversity-generating retroelement protein Avd [bacterium]|nr:diversity-generating retroelement protein Avd [bacterium]
MQQKLAPVILKHYDLILWFFPHVSKFSRNYKFLLGDRIENLLLDILSNLITANYSIEARRKNLIEANLKLDHLRILARLCKDLNLLSFKSYQYQAEIIDEIGRQIGGWMRSN